MTEEQVDALLAMLERLEVSINGVQDGLFNLMRTVHNDVGRAVEAPTVLAAMHERIYQAEGQRDVLKSIDDSIVKGFMHLREGLNGADVNVDLSNVALRHLGACVIVGHLIDQYPIGDLVRLHPAGSDTAEALMEAASYYSSEMLEQLHLEVE